MRSASLAGLHPSLTWRRGPGQESRATSGPISASRVSAAPNAQRAAHGAALEGAARLGPDTPRSPARAQPQRRGRAPSADAPSPSPWSGLSFPTNVPEATIPAPTASQKARWSPLPRDPCHGRGEQYGQEQHAGQTTSRRPGPSRKALGIRRHVDDARQRLPVLLDDPRGAARAGGHEGGRVLANLGQGPGEDEPGEPALVRELPRREAKSS